MLGRLKPSHDGKKLYEVVTCQMDDQFKKAELEMLQEEIKKKISLHRHGPFAGPEYRQNYENLKKLLKRPVMTGTTFGPPESGVGASACQKQFLMQTGAASIDHDPKDDDIGIYTGKYLF